MPLPRNFYQQYGKNILDLLVAFTGLVFFWPVFAAIAVLVKLDSSGPVIFKQKRIGKNGRTFTIYKFRTMVKNSEELKNKYRHLNEADEPVFKIRNDPRFTPFGKYLSHTGLDELPQLINILKREMSLVGPRPLPLSEEQKIPRQYRRQRQLVRPGLVSSWLITGAHEHSFKDWMGLDQEDIKNSSFFYDTNILYQSIILAFRLMKSSFRRNSLLP